MPRRKVDNSLFLERMSRLHPRIKVLTEYQAAKIPVECECMDCGCLWSARPLNLTFEKSPTGCPQCGGSRKKSHKDFVSEVISLHPEIEILGEYIDSHTPVLVRCKVHDHSFVSIPTNLIRRAASGCQYCSVNSLDSKLASDLKQYCIDHFDGVVTEYRVLQNPVTGRWLPYDIYIPDINGEAVFCEIMSRQHYSFIQYCHGTEDNYMRQVARDHYKELYANTHGRYVEIDARKIKSVSEAIPLLLGENISWLQRKALDLKLDFPTTSDDIEFIYSYTLETRSPVMKNVYDAWNARQIAKRQK